MDRYKKQLTVEQLIKILKKFPIDCEFFTKTRMNIKELEIIDCKGKTRQEVEDAYFK